MPRKIRALVVDDSAFMRTNIKKFLEASGTIEVVGLARNGRQAIEQTVRLEPDVITMDVEMPEMDGIEAVRRIMRECPTPILMVSSYTDDGAETTLRALEAGAVDYLPKPGGAVTTVVGEIADQLAAKTMQAAQANARAFRRLSRSVRPVTRSLPTDVALRRVICMGVSTGGPATLRTLLAMLPGDIPAGLVIAQHMPAAHTRRFAKNLDDRCELTVREAAAGDRVRPALALLAPGGYDTLLGTGGKVRLSTTTEDATICPSADSLMESAAVTFGAKTIGVVLSGMGEDGARGIEAIKRAGGWVIAQDESTSVVYGMPRAAFLTGCVDEVLPLGSIAEAILAQL